MSQKWKRFERYQQRTKKWELGTTKGRRKVILRVKNEKGRCLRQSGEIRAMRERRMEEDTI